ncbi:MAG TPA: GNAT family N-acetyltransferase [Coriobacteriia bacterium]
MVRVHPLRPENDRSHFASGDRVLDRFLAEFAGQNMDMYVGVTYVAEESGFVLGYVTLAACSTRRDEIAETARGSLPAYPLPALRVARLAVDRGFQGQGIGTLLLGAAFDIAIEMTRTVGCVAVLVDAKSGATGFYERFGFEERTALEGASAARPRPVMMSLSIAAVLAARKG